MYLKILHTMWFQHRYLKINLMQCLILGRRLLLVCQSMLVFLQLLLLKLGDKLKLDEDESEKGTIPKPSYHPINFVPAEQWVEMSRWGGGPPLPPVARWWTALEGRWRPSLSVGGAPPLLSHLRPDLVLREALILRAPLATRLYRPSKRHKT